ncbi:hypothetical protein ABZP36_020802 [Zizania latifolia]
MQLYEMAASQCFAFALLVSCIAFFHHAPAADGAAPANQTGDFLGCLAVHLPPGIVYTHSSQSYPDLDLGVYEDGAGVASYEKARVWGEAYFKGNFERLAAVKAKVDPHDFFTNEQSIPPLPN